MTANAFKTAESPFKADSAASKTLFFANPEDAADYLGFGLTPASA